MKIQKTNECKSYEPLRYEPRVSCGNCLKWLNCDKRRGEGKCQLS